MHAAEFEYMSPPSLERVISLLDRHGDEAKLLAGGQSLIPMMTLRLLQPRFVIDLKDLLDGDIRRDDGWLVIPGGVRHRTLTRDPQVAAHAPAVSQAARRIGNVRVRTLGTIGGSVAHADPAAELPCVLTALGAEIGVLGKDGRRVIPAGDFFVTYLTTALGPTELVVEVRVPSLQAGTGQAFAEMTRRASDFAVVEVAAVVQVDDAGRCRRVSLVYGGVADSPLDVSAEASAVLVGERPSAQAFLEVAQRARRLAQPPDDVHGSAAYRSQLIETLGRRVLHDAAEHARAGRG
jgi:CO/xanthine dehydrogenase FAD-binding subunit